jgi:hypothetical protein
MYTGTPTNSMVRLFIILLSVGISFFYTTSLLPPLIGYSKSIFNASFDIFFSIVMTDGGQIIMIP